MSARFWRNWAGNERCECDLPPPPGDLGELRTVVREAAAAGRRIRAVGGGYSWSPLVTNEGEVIVRMSRLTRLIRYDEAARTVEVECGMTIKELTRHVAAEGMTVLSPTLFPNPTVGGAIATGSHGMGFGSGCFSDQVVEMTIVRADGSAKTIDVSDGDFRAAQVALGSFGILYSVVLRLVPEFSLYVEKRFVPVQYVLEEFEDLLATYEFVEIFWVPLQDRMWLYLMNTTTSPADARPWWKRIARRFNVLLKTWFASAFIPWLASHAHRATPILNRIASRVMLSEGASVERASDAFHHQKAYAYAWDLSYALPASDASAAWRAAIDLVHEFARARRYPVNFAMHCRFTGKSEAWLAANHDRDTLFIEAATARGTPNWRVFFEELERRWAGFDRARPHWGKLFWRRAGIADQYARMNDFLAARERWDPARVFLNDFLEREVFGLRFRTEPAARPWPQPTAPPPPL